MCGGARRPVEEHLLNYFAYLYREAVIPSALTIDDTSFELLRETFKFEGESYTWKTPYGIIQISKS